MSDFVSQSEFLDGRSAVATTDDTGRTAGNDRFRNGSSAGIERRHFEDTHRSVPDDGLCRFDHVAVFGDCGRSNIKTFPATFVGDLAGFHHLLVTASFEIVAAMRIER